ncbi:hypothetical protein [Jannaschia donghaensis]|uniref:Uncharacterized protein n=1 Tax=Jannaschia donghaensis TaxID=420998 RepID=A0A0M6YN01_9RHOB|nr:hypothetical protein [Jannaschia donghaensis]CTQ50406.1 hypothetical protein JDO7802_02430 [Jannaschia donghaensis]
MNFCFNGLKSGPVCLGDTMAQIHGEAVNMGHVGVAMICVILVAILVFVFRSPA